MKRRVYVIDCDEKTNNKIQQDLLNQGIDFSEFHDTAEALVNEQVSFKINHIRNHDMYKNMCKSCKDEMIDNICLDVLDNDNLFETLDDYIDDELDKMEAEHDEKYTIKIV